MAITEAKCYTPSCDECKQGFSSGDFDEVFYLNPEDALEAVHDSDWLTIKAGEYTEREMLICEDCRGEIEHTCKYDSDGSCGLCWEDRPEEGEAANGG